jgi:hypothetical protein
MRYGTSLLLIIILLACANQPVRAAESDVSFVVYGIGETPCSEFVELIDVSAWQSGGVRAEDSEVQIIAALSDKLTYKFAAKYCVENPDDTIQDAAEDHWLTLKSWEGIKD